MNVLITILGRAGSKGVKNKNLRKFLGFPLVDYTIGAALLFKEKNKNLDVDICLNSDSDKLLELATRFEGVIPIKRPEKLAQDTSPKITAIKYSLEQVEKKNKKQYNYVIDLDITSPLRKVEDIERALKKTIDNKDVDVVFSVVKARRNPYFNMVERRNGEIVKVKDFNIVRRQDAPEVYDMNGSIYCYRRDRLLNKLKKMPFEGKNDIIIMKDTAVLDIDSEEDFGHMELLGLHYLKNDLKKLWEWVRKNNKYKSKLYK